MKRLALLFVLIAPVAASAQPAKTSGDIEQVIVSAPRLSDEVKATIQNFVMTFAAPSPLSDEIARWDAKEPLCPMVYGFTKPSDNEFVAFRIRQIAGQVGAPVKPPPCFPNVEVYFATKPQQLLDGIRDHGASLWLTSHPSHPMDTMKFTHPIQAWYATLTQDDCGSLSFDNEDNGWDGTVPGPGCPPPGHGLYAVTGSRARTGLQSVLGHVYIVVDIGQTTHTSFQAVADYVSLLALSRTQDFEACQPLPSIANLMSAACDAGKKPGAMTATDLAYLSGIYQMDPAASLLTQRSTIDAKIRAAVMSGQ